MAKLINNNRVYRLNVENTQYKYIMYTHYTVPWPREGYLHDHCAFYIEWQTKNSIPLTIR